MAVKTFLVTRSLAQGQSFAADLAARGFAALVAPLTAIRLCDGPPLDLTGYDLLLVSSANGAAGLARRTPRRDVPLLAVGPQTAAALSAAGFTAVTEAGGDAAAMRAQIPSLVPLGGRLLHVSGGHGKALVLPGYRLERCELYDVIDADRMPDAAAAALRAHALAGAFFFSPLSAALFRGCALRDGLAGFCTPIDAYCISEAAAKMLTPLSFAHLYIAVRPNRAALLDILP